MSKDNEIQLETFFDDKGRLLVRCKESKRLVARLQSVSLSNSIDDDGLSHISINVLGVNNEA